MLPRNGTNRNENRNVCQETVQVVSLYLFGVLFIFTSSSFCFFSFFFLLVVSGDIGEALHATRPRFPEPKTHLRGHRSTLNTPFHLKHTARAVEQFEVSFELITRFKENIIYYHIIYKPSRFGF